MSFEALTAGIGIAVYRDEGQHVTSGQSRVGGRRLLG
jgi:hypothetical protein